MRVRARAHAFTLSGDFVAPFFKVETLPITATLLITHVNNSNATSGLLDV